MASIEHTNSIPNPNPSPDPLPDPNHYNPNPNPNPSSHLISLTQIVGNLHKWLFCPKGCAFLWVTPQHQSRAQGVVISHEWKSSYQARFKMQGTLDDTAFLAVPAALHFIEQVGGIERIAAENHAMVTWAARMLAERWSTEVLVPMERCSSMAVIRCPFEPREPEEDLFGLVWHRFNIVVPVIPMPGMPGVWVRISAQLYNHRSDYEKLADAIMELKAERRKGEGESKSRM